MIYVVNASPRTRGYNRSRADVFWTIFFEAYKIFVNVVQVGKMPIIGVTQSRNVPAIFTFFVKLSEVWKISRFSFFKRDKLKFSRILE